VKRQKGEGEGPSKIFLAPAGASFGLGKGDGPKDEL